MYPTYLALCILTGPSECGKSIILTNLILNIFNESGKMYTYSPSNQQDLYQKYLIV